MELKNNYGDIVYLDSRFDIKKIKSLIKEGKQSEIDNYLSTIKGYPSHAQGGVDIKLGEDGFSFTRDNGGDIKAAHGLVLPTIKAQKGLVMSNTNEPSNNDTNDDVKFEPMELPYYYYKSDAYKQKTMDNYDRLDWDNFSRDHDYSKTKTVLSAKDYPELKNAYLAQQSRDAFNANDYATFDDFYNANKDNRHGGLFPKSYLEELYNLRDKYKTYDAANISTDYDSYKHSKESKKATKYFDKLLKKEARGELKFGEAGKLAEEYAQTLGKGREFLPIVGSGQQYFTFYSAADEQQDIFNENNYKKVAEINKDKESYFNYLSSDDYANVAKKTWGDNYNDMINIQKRRINNTKYTDFDYNKGVLERKMGYYDTDTDEYSAPLHRKTGIDHELGHATDSFEQNNPNSKDVPLDIEHYDKFVKENNISEAYNIDGYKEDMEYYSKPTELRTRINVLRKNLIEQGINIDSLDESALSDYFNSILNIKYDVDEFVSNPSDPSNLKNLHNYFYSDRHPMYLTINALKPIGMKNILILLKEYALNSNGNKIDKPLNDNTNLA